MIANHEPQANKSFLIQQFFKNAGEVWASSPHLRSKSFCNLFSLLQLQFLKLPNSKLAAFMKQAANSNKATGQLQHAGRQKQGWNPLLPDVKDRFSQEELLLGKPIAYGSAESLCCLPVCCSPVLRCPNCLCIFLRLQFTGSFFVFKMANSKLLISLRFQFPLINTFVREDSLTAVACGS